MESQISTASLRYRTRFFFFFALSVLAGHEHKSQPNHMYTILYVKVNTATDLWRIRSVLHCNREQSVTQQCVSSLMRAVQPSPLHAPRIFSFTRLHKTLAFIWASEHVRDKNRWSVPLIWWWPNPMVMQLRQSCQDRAVTWLPTLYCCFV